MSGLKLSTQAPPAEDFVRLRAACGWGEIALDIAERSLSAGLFNVTVRQGDRLAGIGRVVGDGVLYFYVQDVIVHPEFRGRGVGRMIVEALLDEVLRCAPYGATIGLMSAHGKEGFYEKFGFTRRPTDRLGAGMTRFVLADG